MSERSDIRCMSLLSKDLPSDQFEMSEKQSMKVLARKRFETEKSKPAVEVEKSVDFNLTEAEPESSPEKQSEAAEEIEESVSSIQFRSQESSMVDHRPPAEQNIGWITKVSLDSESKGTSLYSCSDLNYSVSDR